MQGSRNYKFHDIGKTIYIKYHSTRTLGKSLAVPWIIDVMCTDKYLSAVRLQKISGNPARARFHDFQTGKAVWIPLKDIIGWVFAPALTKAYANILRKEKKS